MEEPDWKAQFTADVAKEVRRIRLARGLSVQKVADLCAEQYGVPMKRSVLANFEGGRRPTLSVVELMALALILKVPPVQLLFPVGRREETKLFPNESVRTWTALKWFTGEQESQPPSKYVNGSIPQDIGDVAIFRDHDDAVAAYQETNSMLLSLIPVESATGAPRELSDVSPDSLRALVEQFTKARQRASADLLAIRDEIRRRGMTPPELPPNLTYLEEQQEGKR